MLNSELELEKKNPIVYEVSKNRKNKKTDKDINDSVEVPIDEEEIFDYIRDIHDPEHPLSLEQLNVVSLENIRVKDSCVSVRFTPTIPHCSLATLIGLAIKTKLLRSLPLHFKIDVSITPGSHSSEKPINKQLADKERVAAALENKELQRSVDEYAFKYEFAYYNQNQTKKHSINQFPISHKLIKDDYGILMEALADPPTTTLQRLKGLTTGSLPTFIDASSNFGSYEIQEDNLISQLVRNNKSVVFAGDDTWLTLYPSGFKRSYPYPSFNIRDLDTVDRGVEEKLKSEIHRRDWDVFIGHFLGVDHAGHSYGPNHSEMSRKIKEMDEIVRYVADEMSNDTVLFVLGDHGMTITGDHGGDSRDEISSTFLIYNKKFKFQNSENTRLVNPSQIDFLPTACLWMGLPIPFSNLGAYLPLLHDAKYNHNFIKSNVDQVMSYFDGYLSIGSRHEFSKSKVRQLEDLFSDFKSKLKGVMSLNDFQTSQKLGFEILDHAKQMCQSVWAQFNLTPMGAGLSLIIIHTTAIMPLFLISGLDFQRVMEKECGNLNGVSPVVALVKYVPSFMGLTEYTLTILYYDNAEEKLKKEVPKVLHQEASSIYNYLKMQYAKAPSSNINTVKTVYGLGTALSAPIVALLVCVSLSSMLVLGDGLCPSIAVMLLSMVVISFVNTIDNPENSVRFSSIFLWWLAQNVFFYASGHSTTLNSIQWSAAFVGFDGELYGKDSYIIPFILVTWNTYVSRILFGLALPLLFLSSYTVSLFAPFLIKNGKEEEKKKRVN
ncbi:PIGO [Lepeophtheirus salmonis]|uniref:PIGO n=1 Tax=Lepeophtheirus salmonis TaxID=72036 RepID=A0A7R8CUU9_LEPSM|nr:PIGO [Lepeophtheirus salmonis]CAF2937805.1 PIGO [Lepeophtheirus salmonis]